MGGWGSGGSPLGRKDPPLATAGLSESPPGLQRGYLGLPGLPNLRSFHTAGSSRRQAPLRFRRTPRSTHQHAEKPTCSRPISGPLAGPQGLIPLAKRRATHRVHPSHWLVCEKNLSLSSSFVLHKVHPQKGVRNGDLDARPKPKH